MSRRVDQSIVFLLAVCFKFISWKKQREDQLKGLEVQEKELFEISVGRSHQHFILYFSYLNEGSEHSYHGHSPYTLSRQFKMHSLMKQLHKNVSGKYVYILIY